MPAPLHLCLHAQDFAAQTVARLRPELRRRPIAILAGNPPGEAVFALNSDAGNIGLAMGMSRLQAESADSRRFCFRTSLRRSGTDRIRTQT